MPSPLDDLKDELARLERAGLTRSLREVGSKQGPEVILQGSARRVLNACSNDYLSLAGHPEVIAAAKVALDQFGAGSGAARLIVGNLAPHVRLEEELRRLAGADVLLFSSGWHANLGTLPTLAGDGDLIISDRLNHASIIDGCRLSRAETGVYPHADVGAVERALSRAGHRRRFIVTESLFSMDGDLAPIAELMDLAKRFDAFLYVDEAHAYGVLGPDGKGACAAAGIDLADPRLIRMGTLGKSYGSYGAFIAAAPEVIRLLVSRSRGFIFTTGIPPAAAAAATEAIRISRREPERRTALLRRAAAMRAMLGSQGWDTGRSCAQIVPLPVGEPGPTMSAAQRLLDAGIHCQGIRPPTVPAGTCRLRVSLTAGHGDEHLTQLARAFGEIRAWLDAADADARGAAKARA